MSGPDKKKLYPNENIKTVCYISNLPKRPNVKGAIQLLLGKPIDYELITDRAVESKSGSETE